MGREGELEVLEEDAGAVVIAGDAGVGKSRLVAELERRAIADNKFVLVGECLELTDGELPYAAVVSALRAVLHHDLATDVFTAGERQQLARLWPELGGEPEARSETDPSNQARVFGLLLRLLTALARQRPVVFIVEDLHWADRSTRDFLAFLVRAARGERILAVATLRLDELPRDHPARSFVAELTRVRGVQRLELSPFTTTELAEQVEGILGERPRADLVARLFERSEGNAFYTEELLAAGGDAELPVSLRDLLLVRIERLSEPARQLLALVATAGRAVDERLLAAVGIVPDAEFAPALREALAQQVLVARGDGGAYAFRHALVSEAVYRDLLAGERTTLHLALARTLADHPELAASAIGVSGELAHHWYSAGDLVRALEASVQAGVDSDRAFAFAETLRHCERALGIWYRVPDAAVVAGIDRVALLERTAVAAVRAEQPQRGAEFAAEAVAELDPDDDPVRLAQVYVVLGRCRWLSADTDGSLAAYGEAVRLVPEQPASPERALVLATEAQALMLTGQSAASLHRCAQALELAEPLDERHVQAHVHNTLAGLALDGGRRGRARGHGAQAVVRGWRRRGDRPLLRQRQRGLRVPRPHRGRDPAGPGGDRYLLALGDNRLRRVSLGVRRLVEAPARGHRCGGATVGGRRAKRRHRGGRLVSGRRPAGDVARRPGSGRSGARARGGARARRRRSGVVAGHDGGDRGPAALAGPAR